MSTPDGTLSTGSAARARPLERIYGFAIWLVGVLIGTFFATVGDEATAVGGTYIPRGNDSFYHARRILDAAFGSRGFYQFDDRLNAPDGSWISWPWAYDWLMAKGTQLSIWLVPTLSPMAFMSYVPVAWLAVNCALFLAAARAAGLSIEMRALAVLCFALSPLTQLLHRTGMIDHHYVEHTFVLLNAWLGLRWFQRPDDKRRAVALGLALGVAPAFHNGLFFLQLVPLGTLFVLWLRQLFPPRAAAASFGIALVVATELVLLPSEPYRNGFFEFGLLSWFHLYVAAGTAAATMFMAWRRYDARSLGLLAVLGVALTIPLVTQIAGGLGFLSGKFSILDEIAEVHSPYRLWTQTLGPMGTAGYYSWLLVLVPALLAYYAYRILREDRPERLYYAVLVAFGLALLLDQWRLHYYGFFGMVTGGLLLLDELRARRSWHRGATFVAAFAVLVLAYQPPLRARLFALDVPGSDFGYANTTGAYQMLHDRCAINPGVVLASSSDSAAILYHSECSVIASNFILRPDDAQHLEELGRLMWLTPAEIRAQRPDVKYVLVRGYDFAVRDGDELRLVADNPLVNELLLADTPPPGFTLIKNIVFRGKEGPAGVYARLYEVSHAEPADAR